MKILHVGKYYPPFYGGIENFMCALMEQQQKEGHQVSAIVHHHETKCAYIEQNKNGINLYRVPSLGQVLYAPISPAFGFYLQKIVKNEKPDLIHIHTPNLSAFWCLLFPSIRKLPWVVQWQSDVIGAVPDIKIKMLYPLYSFFEKALLKKSSAIIVATPPYARTSKPLEQFNNKVEVVPLGLSASAYEYCYIKKNRDRCNAAINLLMIGRLTYYKGHAGIITAVAKLKEQGICFSLMIVGDGGLKSSIVRQIHDLGLEDTVKLLGKLSNDELAEQLNNTDLLCLPSIERTEAFGVVLLEAMRAGKPCLVTDVIGSGMSWVVKDNETGFVVKNNNVENLVNKFKYIYENKNLLIEYGKAGRLRFEKYFSITSVSEEVARLYNKIL